MPAYFGLSFPAMIGGCQYRASRLARYKLAKDIHSTTQNAPNVINDYSVIGRFYTQTGHLAFFGNSPEGNHVLWTMARQRVPLRIDSFFMRRHMLYRYYLDNCTVTVVLFYLD